MLHEVGIISECIDLSCTSFNMPYLYFVHVYKACLVPTEMSVLSVFGQKDKLYNTVSSNLYDDQETNVNQVASK